MSAVPKQHYTIEEYIELLKNSDERFEYFNGEVVTLSGGKIAHVRIALSIMRGLETRLGERPCEVFSNDMALKVPRALPFRYADASVVCGEPIVEPFHGIDMLVNPLVIVEVLSPSTEAYDVETKFWEYQSIASFREYVLVRQDRPHVTHYLRQGPGQWLRTDIAGLEDSVAFPSLEISLPLNEIYRRVVFATRS
jgi:Uma2 family endonuclease